jgi:NADH-quinone oxidoreductase subunit L
MSGPVAILILPTILIGLLDFGGNSYWKQFFAGFFPRAHEFAAPGAYVPPISELVSTAIVFAVVVAGFAVAFVRYYAGDALRNAVARLRAETVRMPAVLVNAYYFDAAYEALLVRPAYALGRWFYRVIDPHVIDAGVREVPISAQWLGHLFRSFQTGLVRAYALTIAVGVACFVAYYAFAFAGAAR